MPYFTQRCVCVLAAVLAGASVTAGGGYLPVTGPVPLRFRAAIPQKNPATALPPLAKEDPAPEAGNETAADMAPIGPEPAPAAEATPQTNVTATPVTVVEPIPYVEAPVIEEPKPVSADMLLQYFKPGSRTGVLMQAPVQFTPPPPARSSTATYNSP